MPLHPSWEDICLRLTLAALAGAVIGLNREGHSEVAGLRTTVLICVAAALAMVLANRLLDLDGRTQSSFARADVMRLPLGVLSGMGFIGAGAVVRRDDIVVGVTTAATLWFMTVVGLCLGAGELALGMGATVAAVAVLWGLKRLEAGLPRKVRATLKVEADRAALPEPELRALLEAEGYRVTAWSATYREGGAAYAAEVTWRGRLKDRTETPAFVQALTARGASRAEWSPMPI